MSVRQVCWLCFAWVCIGLGVVGIFLPLLPTTPFLLLASWAAPKGSPRLDAWLRGHPRLGPLLAAWHEQKAIPRRAKMLAVVTMTVSWLCLYALGASTRTLILVALLMISVSTYVCSRPEPRRA